MSDLIPRRILLADDSQLQRQMMRAICQQIPNVEIYEASDGLWALQLVRKLGHIDLVISDLNMPGMDGIELLRNLATHTDIPAVILISGYAPELLENCERAARELGISRVSHLSKPIAEAALINAAQQLLNIPLAITNANQNNLDPKPLIDIIYGLAHNQFCAYFQPIYDLHSGQILQCEALARWENPTCGLLGPSAFIERLDHEGHLTLLTRRIAQTSFDFLQRQLLPPHLHLSLNLSRSQLEDQDLLDWIQHELKIRGLSPTQIVLEITENSAFANLGQTMATLLHLRLRGFQLSLDDFGIGNTTLEQLRELPITELKFDQSLIKNIHNDPRSQSIIDGMVHIASKLKLSMVAEGVESHEELMYLKTRYPKEKIFIQGFLLGRPMSADKLIEHEQPQQKSA